MASERHVTFVQKLIGLLLFIGIIVAAWYFEPEKLLRAAKQEAEKRQIIPVGNKPQAGANIQAKAPDRRPTEPEGGGSRNVAGPYKRVTILHCHLPGNPASEQMADVFNSIKKKYGSNLVTVIRAGFPAQPVDWQKQKGINLPYVIMIVGSEKAYQFQGLMPLPQVEKKVEELIFGVRRAGKDWRPAVPGMTPKSH
jgi:hypothetical protein